MAVLPKIIAFADAVWKLLQERYRFANKKFYIHSKFISPQRSEIGIARHWIPIRINKYLNISIAAKIFVETNV
ncbi:MAG: hypothetical protein EA405_05400 [Rhodospirillales bacterium]|nr:MAG: hypothetical protein EA405_05400 [Rhodospirillales bacterium]